MANPLPSSIQHLRYFDGEYLRSYDFTDEQSYHIAMRRLMNQKLHLCGIVCGLEIVEDATSTAGATFYSISPGIAIDQTGREIVVPAPYSLNNLLNGPGLTTGPNEVWLCYQESETGLPAAGYLDCNVKNQNTRWQETFFVQFQPTSGPSLFTQCGGVKLGNVTLSHPSTGWTISSQPSTKGRWYVGIRAQEIKAPDQIDQSPDPYDITALTTPVTDHPLPGYLDVHPGVYNHGNVIVDKNLLVGPDFVLNPSDASGPSYNTNLPTLTPPIAGNVKISNDLFVQGSIYTFDSAAASPNQWSQLAPAPSPPSIKTSATPVPVFIGPDNTGGGTGSAPVIPITAPSVTSPAPQVMLAITGIDWIDPKHFSNYWGAASASSITMQVTASVTQVSGSTTWNLTINWNAGPSANTGGSPATYVYPVTCVYVNYVVVFTP